MPPIDMYHIIALAVGFVLKLLWERFVGPAPASAPPSPAASTPAAAASSPPGGAAAAVSLPGLLDNPAALQLLRELLHATPPRPAAPPPPPTL